MKETLLISILYTTAYSQLSMPVEVKRYMNNHEMQIIQDISWKFRFEHKMCVSYFSTTSVETFFTCILA